jgi:hypothetical protein
LLAQQSDVSRVLSESLYARSNDWAPGAVEEVVAAVLDLAAELRVSISPEQLKEMANGMRDPAWGDVVSEGLHPLTRKQRTLRMVHSLREYLVLGSGDERSRSDSVAQAKLFIGRCQDEILAANPGRKQVILEAARQVVADVEQKSGSALLRKYTRPVAREVIEQAQRSWGRGLTGFAWEPEADVQSQVFRLKNLFLAVLNPVTHASRGRSLPPTPALAEVEQQIVRNLAEISEWDRRAIDRQLEARVQAKRKEMTLSDLGASAKEVQSLLDRSISDVLPDPAPWSRNSDSHADRLPARASPQPDGAPPGTSPLPASKSPLGGRGMTLVILGGVIVLVVGTAVAFLVHASRRSHTGQDQKGDAPE